ncbi:hypothetical protein VTK73DRAFT_4199 [Phialemonium thermophilum]|uniref:Cytochrome P450 n=1 Tax=Phialemonium thermophilum TaxID=223376 RepID=A0ABR3VBB6_9PEZI
MLQWMIDKADATKEPASDDELAFVQLQLSMAAIHTTTMTATHILYDLVAHPDVVEDLRAEVRSVLRETGGVVTTHALFQMKLLDSVMRESQRMNPLSMARFTRYVEKPLTLHDGTKIPAGVVIESPHLAVTRDPELYPDPDTFDPYRFYRLRTGEVPDPLGYKSTEQYQFVTVTKENMGFGYGRHACPGRFFAANEIKMILAHMLLRFDMKLPASRAGKRYPNLVVAHSIVPDPKGEILLRRVQS